MIFDNGLVTSVNGSIIVDGTGNGTVSENYGLFLQNGGKIASTGTGVNVGAIFSPILAIATTLLQYMRLNYFSYPLNSEM